ncbi:hypothetical protein J7643_07700 [bacterium]|nr:hypothetical protein [bacterium]
MKKHLSLLTSSLLLLAGCAAGPQVARTGSGAMLVLTPEVVSGGYQTQDVPSIEPFTAADVKSLVVKLYTVTDGVETPVTENGQQVSRGLTSERLGDPVVFSKLKPHTTYRAKCEAYGFDIRYPEPEVITMTLLSTNDANSYTDIVVTDDDRPTVGKLKVRLKARLFSGQTDFDVTIGAGGLFPGASESLALEPLD